MRLWVMLLAGAAALAGGGCAAVAFGTAGAVASTTVHTIGKLAYGSRTASGQTTTTAWRTDNGAPLTAETAAMLAKTDRITVVTEGTISLVEMPWRSGLRIYEAAEAAGQEHSCQSARVFRGGSMFWADMQRARVGTGDLRLQPGDVVELRR